MEGWMVTWSRATWIPLANYCQFPKWVDVGIIVFLFPPGFANHMIEKGSICIDGISLTVFNLGRDQFTVTIIPFTQEHTNFKSLIGGDLVNLEFDMVGKYIARQFQLANPGYQNIQG